MDMADAEEPSIVVDAWHVPDGAQDEFIDALVALFSRLRQLDGFIDGEILRGVDPTHFVTYARMRSPGARDAAFLDGEVLKVMRAIRGVAHPGPGAYRVLRRFTPEGDSA